MDPVYEKANKLDISVGEDDKDEEEISDMSGRPVPNEVQGLHLSEEDRAIGVVSSGLYWNYFRSGVPLLVIIAGVCLCLISQGNVPSKIITTEPCHAPHIFFIPGKVRSAALCRKSWKTEKTFVTGCKLLNGHLTKTLDCVFNY